jgi:hypothetical protein
MITFNDYIDNKKLDHDVEILADLIVKTGFPIKEFVEWYIKTGIFLKEEMVIEGFWGGAAVGSILGPGGAMLGGALGGALGATQWGQNLAAGVKGGLGGWYGDWKTNAKLGQLNTQRQIALKELGKLKTIADDPALNVVPRLSNPKGYRALINRIIEKLSSELQRQQPQARADQSST